MLLWMNENDITGVENNVNAIEHGLPQNITHRDGQNLIRFGRAGPHGTREIEHPKVSINGRGVVH